MKRSNQIAKASVVLALAAGLVGAAAAGSASAHVAVVKTKPSGSAPKTVRTASVLFDGPVRSGTIRVKGPGGRLVSKGSGGRDPRNVNRVIVPLRAKKKVGAYAAKVRVVAADGHDQKFRFSFTLRKP